MHHSGQIESCRYGVFAVGVPELTLDGAAVDTGRHRANARWFAEVFGQAVENATANLSPEIMIVAKACGEMFDLGQAAKELLAEHGAGMPQRDFDAMLVSR